MRPLHFLLKIVVYEKRKKWHRLEKKIIYEYLEDWDISLIYKQDIVCLQNDNMQDQETLVLIHKNSTTYKINQQL